MPSALGPQVPKAGRVFVSLGVPQIAPYFLQLSLPVHLLSVRRPQESAVLHTGAVTSLSGHNTVPQTEGLQRKVTVSLWREV